MVALTLLGAGVAAAQGQARYTDDHLRLAGHIGAVVGLVKQCGVVPMPASSIQAAVRAAGLKDSDFLNKSTAFHQRVQEQANAVAMITALRRHQGASERELAADACGKLAENYGPRGTIRAGLVPGR